MSGYGIQFAESFARPPETMVGECVYDEDGNHIGWITATTVGVGTCKNVSTTGNFRCSECDAADLDFDKPTYCHGCGRKVVGA